MINDIEVYRESGRRAAKAVNENDWPRHNFERHWFNRAVRLEREAVRVMIRNSWAQAYSEARNVPKFTPFK